MAHLLNKPNHFNIRRFFIIDEVISLKLLSKPNAGRVHVHVYVTYKVHTIYLVVILMYALHSVF